MLLYNTLTHDTEPLPLAPGPIRMYFWGPTVYRRIHIGNARPFVISAWLRRWLIETGYEVTLVENITDGNDKIYQAAPGHSAELAAQAAAWYIEDTDRLGLGRPDVEPTATEPLGQPLALIEEPFLGLVFEIHGGGLDLIFPHRENELAQSRGAGREFAKIWMHNGMLEMGGADMQKSLGNAVSLHAALNAWGPETLLVFFM